MDDRTRCNGLTRAVAVKAELAHGVAAFGACVRQTAVTEELKEPFL
jgi:hypothetical protein